MVKRYSAPHALGLGNMTPDMTKHQKDAVERASDAKMEKHFRSHRELPVGKNFTCWNHEHNPTADEQYRQNFDRLFPNAPGAGL
jgi:hypothetical protein